MIRSMLLLNSCEYYDIRLWERFEERGLEPEAFIREGAPLWRELGISERCAAIMSKNAASGWVDRELDKCAEIGARVVTCRDAVYPKSLAGLEDAPLLLYMRGDIFSPGSSAVGVVGTRRCSAYACGVARDIGRRAGACGMTVVSGGAKGIDGAAHSGCLEAGGRTIAVFGNGLDVVYPAEHRALFDKIAERGALFSEYPLGAKGEAWRFPRRNRIIAGLASRVVVVEAPLKSGAMISARQAGEYGREVWAVPGRIGDARCEGSNRLIFDGAQPLVGLDIFFGEIDEGIFASAPREEPRQAAAPALSDAEKTLVALLTDNGGMTIDNLAAEAKMSAAEVFKAISVLSIKGIITTTGPGRYGLTD